MVSDSKDLRLARFSCSAHLRRQWPEDLGAEVAFAGRSNVGKSSALNAITGQSRLARTSKTPGRTQQIVFFNIDPNRRLVDLPGYGYAKVPSRLQKHWGKMVRHYLENRAALRGLILPIDIRRGFNRLDEQLLDWCGNRELPVHILLTKSDKLSKAAANIAIAHLEREIRWNQTTVQLFSALRKIGIEAAGIKILEWLEGPH